MKAQKIQFHAGFRHQLNPDACYWPNARRYHYAQLICPEDDGRELAAVQVVDAAGNLHPLHIDEPFIYLDARNIVAIYGLHPSGRMISA